MYAYEAAERIYMGLTLIIPALFIVLGFIFNAGKEK